MIEKNLLLDIDTILNKEFPIDFKGYPPQEVDQFLDSVIRDYDTYEAIIAEQNERINFIQENNDSLKAKIMELESKLKDAQDKIDNAPIINSNNASSLAQVDILRRLSRLEQEVFSKK